jgi:hypothetical protein
MRIGRNKFFQFIIIILITFDVALIYGIGNFFIHRNIEALTVSKKLGAETLLANSITYDKQLYNILPPSNDTPDVNLVEYTGIIRHIFSHSLIIYPEKALADRWNISGYKDNMITVNQFNQILQQLYENNFILIDTKTLYSFDDNGGIHRNKLYLPVNKKPLILSIDDLSYYSYMKNGGFANKLVLENGVVKTEVIDPNGNKIITSDGDIVPILDTFIKKYPDFSLNGAKGIIALTGFQGILGYRTQLQGANGDKDRQQVKAVVDALKKSGWVFASHSYSHNQRFLNNKITRDYLAYDISRWENEVEPLVGKTDIFIGPFGQVFSQGDPKRQQLIDAGFKVLFGVGMDGYTKFFDTYMVMNRANIDGYRIANNPKMLFSLFGISVDEHL